jgi:hypothetical protein
MPESEFRKWLGLNAERKRGRRRSAPTRQAGFEHEPDNTYLNHNELQKRRHGQSSYQNDLPDDGSLTLAQLSRL